MKPELEKTPVKSSTHVLEPERIVEDVVREFPETLAVFARHKVDLCCGGRKTLAAAAQSHRVPIETLLQELEKALTRSR